MTGAEIFAAFPGLALGLGIWAFYEKVIKPHRNGNGHSNGHSNSVGEKVFNEFKTNIIADVKEVKAKLLRTEDKMDEILKELYKRNKE